MWQAEGREGDIGNTSNNKDLKQTNKDILKDFEHGERVQLTTQQSFLQVRFHVCMYVT